MAIGVGLALVKESTSFVDKVFVSEKVLIEEFMMGRISWDMFKECMEKADIHFVKNDEDPKPFNHFKAFYPLANVMRRYNKIRARRKELAALAELERDLYEGDGNEAGS